MKRKRSTALQKYMRELARKGGYTTFKKHGRKHYSKMGKLSAAKKKRN